MKAVIFGVNGQDGSYLAELLIDKGYKVTGVVRRSSVDTSERIKHIKQLTIVEGDVSDYSSVNDILNTGFHEIYNLAAQSHVASSFKQPFVTTDIDYVGVLNILEVMRKNVGLRENSRFYQASTSEMFGSNFTRKREFTIGGDGQHGLVEPTGNYFKYQDEDTPFSPRSPYAIAKMAAHHAVNTYRDAYNLHASCGILFNHESPRRGELFVTRKITKWLGEFIEQNELLMSVSEPVLYGDKLKLGNITASRDWGHAKDYVEAMWLMLQQDNPDDYVIATGETHTVEEFIIHAFRYMGIDNWQDFVDIDPSLFRPAEVQYLLGNPAKAKTKLGWSPKITFEQLVQEMVLEDAKKARSKS